MGSDAAETSTGVHVEPRFNSTRARLHLPIIASILLAILAAGVVFGVYRAAFPLYDVPPHLLRMFPSDEDAVKREQEKDFARTVHATAALGLLGALLGLFLGAGEAFSNKDRSSVFPRVFAGVITATILGALGGLVGAQIIVRLDHVIRLQEHAMVRTVLGQVTMFGLLGLGVGFAVGAVSGNRRLFFSAMGGGLAIGLLAAVAFPIVAAFALPRVQTDVVIPDGSGGIFGIQGSGQLSLGVWLTVPCILLGLLLRPIANRDKAPKGSPAVET